MVLTNTPWENGHDVFELISTQEALNGECCLAVVCMVVFEEYDHVKS